MRPLRSRKPLESCAQWEDGCAQEASADWSSESGLEDRVAERMSDQSCSSSRMNAVRRAGERSMVARRDADSCSCVKTGQKLCGLTTE